MTAAELDLPPAGSGTGFSEIARRADDFAIAAAAAVVTRSANGGVDRVRLALAGVADRPVRSLEAEQACGGEELTEEVLNRVAEAVASSIAPETDAFVSADYRRRAASTCAVRALRSAWQRTRN
jgi:carbon-monoxide dehydrogenase medium subunit